MLLRALCCSRLSVGVPTQRLATVQYLQQHCELSEADAASALSVALLYRHRCRFEYAASSAAAACLTPHVQALPGSRAGRPQSLAVLRAQRAACPDLAAGNRPCTARCCSAALHHLVDTTLQLLGCQRSLFTSSGLRVLLRHVIMKAVRLIGCNQSVLAGREGVGAIVRRAPGLLAARMRQTDRWDLRIAQLAVFHHKHHHTRVPLVRLFPYPADTSWSGSDPASRHERARAIQILTCCC